MPLISSFHRSLQERQRTQMHVNVQLWQRHRLATRSSMDLANLALGARAKISRADSVAAKPQYSGVSGSSRHCVCMAARVFVIGRRPGLLIGLLTAGKEGGNLKTKGGGLFSDLAGFGTSTFCARSSGDAGCGLRSGCDEALTHNESAPMSNGDGWQAVFVGRTVTDAHASVFIHRRHTHKHTRTHAHTHTDTQTYTTRNGITF